MQVPQDWIDEAREIAKADYEADAYKLGSELIAAMGRRAIGRAEQEELVAAYLDTWEQLEDADLAAAGPQPAPRGWWDLPIAARMWAADGLDIGA